jgi:hypothetical protein
MMGELLMSIDDIEAYRQFDTTKIGNDHAIDLHKKLYAFAKLNDNEKKEIMENIPYVNTSDTFLHMQGCTYYKIKTELITRLQSFQNKCSHSVIDPREELAQTMELDAILGTMQVQGARFYMPTLAGNVPTPKPCITYKEKTQCVLEMCEYIRIRTENNGMCKILEIYLMSTLGPRVSPKDTNTIMQLIMDIQDQTQRSYSNNPNLAAWAASEYMSFSFGEYRVY